MSCAGKAIDLGNSRKFRSVLVLLSFTLLPMLQGCAVGGPAPGVQQGENAVLLKNAVASMQALKSYHFSVLAGNPAQHAEMSGDVDAANNRARLVITGTNGVSNVIVIGGDAYVSENGGGYTKAALDDLNLDSVLGIWDRFRPEDIDIVGNALKDGSPPMEEIDGVSTKHIAGDAAELNALTGAGSDTEQEGTVEFWVLTGAEPYVYQMRVDGKSGGKDIDGTFKWSRFNETFDIKPPEGQ